jgi:hypothetical protein
MGVCDTFNKKEVDSKQFFRETKTFNAQTNEFQSSDNKVKLEFTIEDCKIDSRYQVMVEFINAVVDPFLTETVRAKYNKLTFNTCYICDYFFERPQLMRITLLKNGNQIGSLTPYLGMIIGSPNSVFRTNISAPQINREIIVVSAVGVRNPNSSLIVNFLIKTTQIVDLSKINNKISFLITSNQRKVYSSESISKYCQFKSVTIPLSLLEPQFEIYFLNSSQKKIVSKLETPNSFVQQNNKRYLSFYNNDHEYIVINNSQLSQQYSFIDYIKNGVQLALSIGIDFTASNGQIDDPNSLHRIIPGQYNDYEQAIRSCGLIIAFYDYDQLIPVYGFGAVVNNNPKPNMCFNINFQPNPSIYTIDNVIEEYRNCLRKVILAGPTEFSPMIRNEINSIKEENNPLIYHVLMILTDGVIVDQQATIDSVIEASFLPFSLIIIGIGNDHFQEMIELDGDDAPLISSNGVKRLRDCVQFVPFNRYRNNEEELASQVLAEIPRQIVEYYSLLKIFPNALQTAKLRCNTMMNNYNIDNY